MYKHLLLDGFGEVMRLSWFEVQSTQQVRVMKVGEKRRVYLLVLAESWTVKGGE